MASHCIRLDVINFVALRPPTICFHRSLLDGVQVLDRRAALRGSAAARLASAADCCEYRQAA
jgi:hypothetical protein